MDWARAEAVIGLRSKSTSTSKALLGLALISIGIAAGSISLFANLLTPLDMADWAWSVVGPWQDVTFDLWGWLLERITLPGSLAPVLNVAAALLLTSYGVRLRDHEGPAKDLSHPRAWLFGTMLALLAIGYASLAGQPQPRGTGEAATSLPLLIFLAAATTSFSPVFAGRGNLTKHLWLLLAVPAILMGLKAVEIVRRRHGWSASSGGLRHPDHDSFACAKAARLAVTSWPPPLATRASPGSNAGSTQRAENEGRPA